MLEDDQWKPVRLCDISSIKHGWAFKGEYMFEELTGKPILVNIGNFSYTGGFRFESTRTREYRGEYPKEYELKPGDILLAMTCQTSGGEILGIPARVPDDGRVYLHNQRLGKVVVNNPEKVFPGFLYWLFLWKNFNAHLCATATGTKILHTAPNRIEEYAFLLPPINGQKNIARTLYAIDNKIQLNLSINALLETVGEAVFKRWFVEFEFPNEEGKPYKSSGGEMVYNQELGKEIPLGWQLTTLEKVAEFTRGFSYNGLEKSTIEGDLVFMTLNSIYEGGGFKREFAYLTSNRLKDRHLLNEGDLIIPNTEQTKTGTLLGFPALVEFPNN
jgi:type I restriction enzyme S subunit